jgi:hypothetical protein
VLILRNTDMLCPFSICIFVYLYICTICTICIFVLFVLFVE